jgi:hypothetical protein
MQKIIPIKFVSQLMLIVLLAVMINAVHESAHAMQSHVIASIDQAPSVEFSVSHQCPCAPLEQHNDYDGCDTWTNCACHAPLTIQLFQLSYNPSVLDNLYASAPFNSLPEVFLSLFVPPDSATV